MEDRHATPPTRARPGAAGPAPLAASAPGGAGALARASASGPGLARSGRLARRLRARYGGWAVVTGASDGIGREIACRLAEAGLPLVLIARRGAALEALSQELAARHGVQVHALPADLSTPQGIEAVRAGTKPLDVGLLVAAAGFGTSGPFLDADLAVEQEMLAVNCGAVLALRHAIGRRLARRGRGGIVLLGSIVGFQGVPRAAHYAATKAYVQSLGEALHVELAPAGVDVLSSAPGPVRSGFGARADMRMGLALQPRDVAQATLEALGRRTTARPGWLSMLLYAALALLPRALRVHVMARVMGGMTAHHLR